MKKIWAISTISVFCLLLGAGLPNAQAQNSPAFLPVETQTFDKEDFIFPDDFAAQKLNIVFLGMSADQDNGQYQQEELLKWHAALAEQGVFDADTMAYHFPVMEKPPFFVRGIIRNAMSESYEGKVPLSQAGVLYVKDLDDFASAADLALDQQATIVLVTADGQIHEVFKGEVSPQGLEALQAARKGHLGPADQEAAAEVSGESPQE